MRNRIKYLIILGFMSVGIFISDASSQAFRSSPQMESFKSPEKGPVLHPLRRKPYLKKTYLT